MAKLLDSLRFFFKVPSLEEVLLPLPWYPFLEGGILGVLN